MKTTKEQIKLLISNTRGLDAIDQAMADGVIEDLVELRTIESKLTVCRKCELICDDECATVCVEMVGL